MNEPVVHYSATPPSSRWTDSGQRDRLLRRIFGSVVHPLHPAGRPAAEAAAQWAWMTAYGKAGGGVLNYATKLVVDNPVLESAAFGSSDPTGQCHTTAEPGGPHQGSPGAAGLRSGRCRPEAHRDSGLCHILVLHRRTLVPSVGDLEPAPGGLQRPRAAGHRATLAIDVMAERRRGSARAGALRACVGDQRKAAPTCVVRMRKPQTTPGGRTGAAGLPQQAEAITLPAASRGLAFLAAHARGHLNHGMYLDSHCRLDVQRRLGYSNELTVNASGQRYCSLRRSLGSVVNSAAMRCDTRRRNSRLAHCARSRRAVVLQMGRAACCVADRP